MGILEFLEKIVHEYSKLVFKIGSITLLILVLVTMSDVIGRYVFDSPILGVNEGTSWYGLPLVLLFGMAAAQRSGRHINVTVVSRFFPEKVASVVDLVILVVSFGLVSLICWQDILLMIFDWRGNHTIFGLLPLPLVVTRIIVFIAFSSFGLELLVDIFRSSAIVAKVWRPRRLHPQ
ncbi:MAG: TRAP transporter small permease [SAR324 cluster bacterium]|nr:TRAP transporter small permease [SAR324 cluster bacterium]